MTDARQHIQDLMALFSATGRLYHLTGEGFTDLMVERWHQHSGVSALSEMTITVISPDAHRDLVPLIGHALTLQTTCADGALSPRTGLLQEVAFLDSDGGLARYQLTVVPWLWYTTQGRHSRVFQHKTVLEIIDQVWREYAGIAAWRYSDDLGPFMAEAPQRDYCAQYRETDYAFIERLLAEEGIGYCFVEAPEAPAGHAVTLFADSTGLPEDPSSAAAGHIRFHRAAGPEHSDTIQHFSGHRRLTMNSLAQASYCYATQSQINHRIESPGGPSLTSYDDPGADAFATRAQAQRATRLALQAHHARSKDWHGQGTVRTLRPGTTFELAQANLDPIGLIAPQDDPDRRRFTVLQVIETGINNLPGELARHIEATLMPVEDTILDPASPPVDPALIQQAQATGYANHFTALRQAVPWRPILTDDTGARLNPRPTAPGAQTATVVGPNGQTTPSGADAIHTDALGRIRVKFHWQRGEAADDRLSCWLRVVQRHAGAGQGSHFIPRIGHEVLVQFLGGDIDRPIVTGSLYNGQGEAGLPATPGQPAHMADLGLTEHARDHRISAQGNTAGGQSPAWHGHAPGLAAHNNTAALSGYKSAEFGGPGHNQLVLDDSNHQQRIQLGTTQATSQLNLGHIIHQADNYRGSFRGAGFELRTDAYGAIRGEQGVLLSTYPLTSPATPAGDFTAGQTLLEQAAELSRHYSQIATTHQTGALAAHTGSNQVSTATIDTDRAPLAALVKTTQGQVTARDWPKAKQDAEAKNTTADKKHIPHSADPILAVAAKAGIGTIAGHSQHHHAGETLTLASGQDHNHATGEQHRIHSGQTIGILAGAHGQGDGLKLVAGDGDLDLQAQSGDMHIQAQGDLHIVSNAGIELAAKKTIHLATAKGAAITIENGKIIVECPGKMTVHAGHRQLTGPGTVSHDFEQLSSGSRNLKQDVALRYLDTQSQIPVQEPIRLTCSNNKPISASLDGQGRTTLKDVALVTQILAQQPKRRGN